MNFYETKSILYNSDAIKEIPDKWEESVPFICKINDEDMDSFLYWNTAKNLELKQLIGINKKSGEVIVLSKDELIIKFGLTSVVFAPIKVNNYDEYLSKKDRYIEIYEKLCNSEDDFLKYGQEEHCLLKAIVGEELYNNVFSVIAKDYIERLT